MNKPKNITGILLSGGKSSRMGSDKALMPFQETNFMQAVIESAKPLVNDFFLVSSKPEHDGFGLERINDIIEDAGPLSALYTGLNHSRTEYNLVLSCDIPFIKTETLKILFEVDFTQFDIVQLASKGKSMPLIAIYKKNCVPVFLDLLISGERRVRKAIESFKTKTIEVDEALAYQVQNINTREQLNSILHEHSH